ncbi:hypothetical protein IC608_15790 [Devosia sp. PTR5]|uniref:Uncharacterized protein n=1 Tax=Devosia oryzisoli TaxID=2774138 RepID=A0A927FV76_9HYPH|nr:hypothetical protein [Devosia oryzisoli]MBD8066935.1 hypothetical protein [Devosia oryzisoli]
MVEFGKRICISGMFAHATVFVGAGIVRATTWPFRSRTAARGAAWPRPGCSRLYFIEHTYAGDPTNWIIPDKAATEARLRTSGFTIAANPLPEFTCVIGLNVLTLPGIMPGTHQA